MCLATFHTAARCNGRTFDLEKLTISGLTNFVLSIKSPDLMRLWRQCIAQDVEDQLDILTGVPTAESEAYRVFV